MYILLNYQITSLKQTKEQIKKLQIDNNSLTEKITDLNVQIVQYSSKISADKKKYDEENEDKNKRVEALEHQNELLLSQIESLNIELDSIKLKLPRDINNTIVNTSSPMRSIPHSKEGII